MESQYHHLSEKDRIYLRILLDKRYSKAKIAEILGVHRSTVYREIKRNSCKSISGKPKDTYYAPIVAQKRYLNRQKRICKLVKRPTLCEYVHDKLQRGWSPWQIEGRLRRENGQSIISHETIYRYIYSNYSIRNRFFKKLRRKRPLRVKQNARKPCFPKQLLIDNRPKHIATRDEFGHWECDLMMFKRGTKANLITLRERKTRYMIAIKNMDKTASGTALALISTIKSLKPYIRSITFDQGSEFQRYDWIKDCLNAAIYFCQPASPYQKGSIENGNGIIRVELPRECDFNALKQRHITQLVDEINARPLKCLAYSTPAEIFLSYKEKGAYESTFY